MVKFRNLKIGLFNAGSLGTKHDELQAVFIRESPDILAINETWLRVGEDGKAPAVPGYKLRHIPRQIGRRRCGGGVGFYIKFGLSFDICPHPMSDVAVEQMWLLVKIKATRLLIGTAYRPDWVDVDTFLDSLTDSISSFTNFDGIILLGDFNIDLLKITNHNTSRLNDFLRYIGLENYVREPTHFTSNSASLIDLVCSDVTVQKTTVTHIPELGGHAVIMTDFKLKRNLMPLRHIVYRPIKDINITTFNKDLESIPWQSIPTLESIDQMVATFNQYMLDLFDRHAPLKTFNTREKQLPWLTSNVRFMMKLRNGAHRRYMKSRLQVHKQQYKTLKQLVNNALYQEKKVYFDRKINCNLKSPKYLWKNLKRTILPNTKNSELLPDHLLDPEALNVHFLDVVGDKNVPLSNLTFYEFHRHNLSVLQLQPTDEQLIAKILLGIKTNAEGIDRINMDMILLTLPLTLPVITAIVNKSILTSTFPSQWKSSIIKPVPKCNNPCQFKDLRPISILPCLSKVLEKVVYNQMFTFSETNKILPALQSGFRKHFSTSTALLNVVDDILTSQDAGCATILTLLDFSRAFDSINITLLLSKLSYYGFGSSTVKWFNSYLSDRMQHVEVQVMDGSFVKSGMVRVDRGVPQGSILGPFLFILYSADIIECVTRCNYHLYADDLQIYLSTEKDARPAVNSMNSDLDQISRWSERNSLVLNPLKSKFMILGSKHQILNVERYNPEIVILGEPLQRVKEVRNLGLLMDDRLLFENHVLELARNCFYRLRLLYRIRNFISVDLRIGLCESLILSKLNYCITVFGPRLLSRSHRLIQRVQNACARFCFHIPPRTHVTPYINQSNILKMKGRLSLFYANLVFEVVKTKEPEYLYQKLRWRSSLPHYRDRSCSFPLRIPSYRTAAFRGSFKYSATKCWNNLPPPFRDMPNRLTFKIKYKSFLLAEQKAC